MTPLRWGLVASLTLHVLLLWPGPSVVPRPVQVSGSIRAELRPPLQGAGSVAQSRDHLAAFGTPPQLLEEPGRSGVPAARAGQGRQERRRISAPGTKAPPARVEGPSASRQEAPLAGPPLPVSGDALTRYRLSLAWHAGHLARSPALGHLAKPVTIELSVHLIQGRVVRVAAEDDGGAPELAVWAVEQVRQMAAEAAVPEDLAAVTVRVGLALRFEP